MCIKTYKIKFYTSKGAVIMSDTLNICGLEAGRGQKLRTALPVPGTAAALPVTIINGQGDGPTLLAHCRHPRRRIPRHRRSHRTGS